MTDNAAGRAVRHLDVHTRPTGALLEADTALVLDAIYGPDGRDETVSDVDFEWKPSSSIVPGRTGGTVNDAVAIVLGTAMRRYLGELDALPDRPLVAGVVTWVIIAEIFPNRVRARGQQVLRTLADKNKTAVQMIGQGCSRRPKSRSGRSSAACCRTCSEKGRAWWRWMLWWRWALRR